MLTDLEKYLEEKRRELDVESPEDAAIWEGIRNKLHEKKGKSVKGVKVRPFVQVLKVAAVVFILFSVGYITKDIIDRRSFDRKVTLSDISQVLGRREMEYRSLVNLKSEEVKSFTGTDNLVIKELFEEIKKLDVVYDQALKDLKEMGYNEKIINTIFDTYEKKIHLLELIILETNKSGSHENNGKINL
jgi:hypothetical protein